MHAAAAPPFFAFDRGRPPRRGERWTLGVGAGIGFASWALGVPLYTIR